jgi:hypothetical protein
MVSERCRGRGDAGDVGVDVGVVEKQERRHHGEREVVRGVPDAEQLRAGGADYVIASLADGLPL